jgi:hypothetical protein
MTSMSSTNGGAEHPDDHGSGGRIRGELRPERAHRDLAPGNVDHEQDGRVGEQGQREPFENGHVALVGDEDLQRQRDEHKHRRHEVSVDVRHQLGDFPHPRHVRRDIENVGHEERQNHGLEDRRRESGFDIGGEPLPRGAADQGTHRLDRRHERIGERHGPQHIQAELGACLGIRRNSTRIVVGGAGDEARADVREGMLPNTLPEAAAGRRARGECLGDVAHGRGA